MKSYKRVVIGIKFGEDEETLRSLGKIEFLKNAEIFLTHVSRVTDYTFLPDLNLPLYPSADAKVIVEQTVLGKLNQIKSELSTLGLTGNINADCIFSENLKKGFCHFVNEMHADLVVLLAEKEISVFDSFIHYQLNHTKAPVLILRPVSH